MIIKRITSQLSIIIAPPLKFTVTQDHFYMYVEIEIKQKTGKNNYKFLRSRKFNIQPRVFRQKIVKIEDVVNEELEKIKC